MPDSSPKRPRAPAKPLPAPSHGVPRIKAQYRVPELAALAGQSVDVMRRRLRALGFPAPGRRVPEVILFSRLRSLAPELCDSLTRVVLSHAEAELVSKRLGGS